MLNSAADPRREMPFVYKDSGANREDRVSDVLSRMTLAEKAGLMFQTKISVRRPNGRSPGAGHHER